MKCQRCNLPQVHGVAGYAGPQCKCWVQVPFDGCQPLRQLTEADVRRIVREELERAKGAT
jgi:hypothetical protein